jgi:hypothetical protein
MAAGRAVPFLHPTRKELVDKYAPVVAVALQAAGMDMPLDVVTKRLLSPNAELVMPDTSDLAGVLSGQLSAASVETVETETTETVTSARDLMAARPLRVSVELGAVSEEVRRAVR